MQEITNKKNTVKNKWGPNCKQKASKMLNSPNNQSERDLILTVKSFPHICRTCLIYRDDLLPIARLTWEDISLKKVLQQWISVEKNHDNSLPAHMCRKCAKMMFKFSQFLNDCKKSDSILKNALSQVSTVLDKSNSQTSIKLRRRSSGGSDNVIENNYGYGENDVNDLQYGIPDNYYESEDDKMDISPSVQQTEETVQDTLVTVFIPQDNEEHINNKLVNDINIMKCEIEQIRNKSIEKLQAQSIEVKDENTGGLCYICATCDKSFKSYEDLAVHKTISKHKASMYQCPYCTKRTNCYPRYVVHLRVHTGEKPNKCPQCGKGFNDKNDCQRHIKYVHQKVTKFKCHLCDRGFKQRHYLTDHLRKHNNEKVICSYCGKDFACMDQLYRHQRVHKQHRIIRRNMAQNQDSLEQNLMEMKAGEPAILATDQFQCDLCQKVLSTDQALRQHVLLHGPKNYACEICGKCFISDRRLEQHKDYAHKDSEPKEPAKRGPKPRVTADLDGNPYAKGEYPCDICGKVLMFQQTLKAHRLLHGPKNYRCEVCGKGFTTDRRLKDHRDMAHEDGKFPCTQCDKVYKQRYILERHMAKVHLGKATTFLCHACDKTFAYRQSLRDHLRLHNGDTQYQCKVCYKICLKRRNLEEHMRMHTGEKPYQCPFCRKCFASKPNMATHMKQHTGVKKHVCSICAKGFYSESSLKKHMMHHEKSNKTFTKSDQFDSKSAFEEKTHENKQQYDSKQYERKPCQFPEEQQVASLQRPPNQDFTTFMVQRIENEKI